MSTPTMAPETTSTTKKVKGSYQAPLSFATAAWTFAILGLIFEPFPTLLFILPLAMGVFTFSEVYCARNPQPIMGIKPESYVASFYTIMVFNPVILMHVVNGTPLMPFLLGSVLYAAIIVTAFIAMVAVAYLVKKHKKELK